MDREIVVLPDLNTVAREAAERVVEIAQESTADHGRFSVALSGGSTPRPLFSLLAGDAFRTRIDWERTVVLWGDERCVPPDHPDSNFGMARDLLLSKVPIPVGNVHRMRGEIAPDLAALEYEQIVRREAGTPASADVPVLDLILLGIGPDGHTASLFPDTAVLHETTRLVAGVFAPKLNAHRITFTPPLINSARHVLFVVDGADKADVLRAVLEGEFKPNQLPAQLVSPTNGKVTWLVDQAAGAKLRLS